MGLVKSSSLRIMNLRQGCTKKGYNYFFYSENETLVMEKHRGLDDNSSHKPYLFLSKHINFAHFFAQYPSQLYLCRTKKCILLPKTHIIDYFDEKTFVPHAFTRRFELQKRPFDQQQYGCCPRCAQIEFAAFAQYARNGRENVGRKICCQSI